MKTQQKMYWITTIVFCLWMLKNAVAYMFANEAKQLCVHFGFPGYFRVELAIAKLIGIAVLLIPIVRRSVKEWAYAGFAITLVSGFVAHLAAGDAFSTSLSALWALAILLRSYAGYHKLQAIH